MCLPYPRFLRPFHLPALTGMVFTFFLLAWIWKTTREAREGRMSTPKTMLLGVTSVVSFLLPTGSNLDVLFQGYNTWHSFQYLFLLWVINRLRYQRGEIDNPLVLLPGGETVHCAVLSVVPRRHRCPSDPDAGGARADASEGRPKLFYSRPEHPADALLLRSFPLQPPRVALISDFPDTLVFFV